MDPIVQILDATSSYLGISSNVLGLICAGGLLVIALSARHNLKGTFKFLLIVAALGGLGYFAYHVSEVGKAKKGTLLQEPTLPSEMQAPGLPPERQ